MEQIELTKKQTKAIKEAYKAMDKLNEEIEQEPDGDYKDMLRELFNFQSLIIQANINVMKGE